MVSENWARPSHRGTDPFKAVVAVKTFACLTAWVSVSFRSDSHDQQTIRSFSLGIPRAPHCSLSSTSVSSSRFLVRRLIPPGTEPRALEPLGKESGAGMTAPYKMRDNRQCTLSPEIFVVHEEGVRVVTLDLRIPVSRVE